MSQHSKSKLLALQGKLITKKSAYVAVEEVKSRVTEKLTSWAQVFTNINRVAILENVKASS